MTERPGYGWLSEETADSPDRLERRRVFVVDPIDGTRAFLAGKEEWAISVAVVEDGIPVAGALYQPTTGQGLSAALGAGAHQGADRLRVSPLATLHSARVAGPKRAIAQIAADHPDVAALPHVPSLALRIARVAQSQIDLALASSHAHDWDLAAADLIVREAGGHLSGPDGKALVYNRPDPRHPALVASGAALWPHALALLVHLCDGAHGGGAS